MNANEQAALSWLGKGVAPIPVMPKSKLPAMEWRLWQKHLPPKRVIDYWFKDPSMNVGVICGGPSNLSIIDFDDINFYYDWRKENLHRNDEWGSVVKSTYRVRTPRGMHLYVKTLQPEKSRKIKDGNVDIRCEGNYTLVPPSVHPSGNLYEPIGSIENIATVSSLQSVFPETVYKVQESVIPVREPDIFDLGANVGGGICEIKNSINILSFVAQFSHVYRSSTDGRWWYARCIHPRHNDTHPSFRIDNKLQRAKCMSPGCQLYHDVGLDVIDLYSILNHVDNRTAIRDLSIFYLS